MSHLKKCTHEIIYNYVINYIYILWFASITPNNYQAYITLRFSTIVLFHYYITSRPGLLYKYLMSFNFLSWQLLKYIFLQMLLFYFPFNPDNFSQPPGIRFATLWGSRPTGFETDTALSDWPRGVEANRRDGFVTLPILFVRLLPITSMAIRKSLSHTNKYLSKLLG